MRPERSFSTWAAVVGEGRVEALADGAATGTPARWMSARARSEEGIRTANVGRPAVTWGARGDGCGSGNSMVSGPGQKRSIRAR